MIARALTIAGSDPTGGAGIQQDLKTFQSLGVWGMSAITAVTVQNSRGVRGWHEIPPLTVAAQIDAVATDMGIDAAKTGMLPSASIIHAVADAVSAANIRLLVVDPVITATSGGELAAGGAVAALRARMLGLATVVTPNAVEAERLTGVVVTDAGTQEKAARALVGMGARAALVKGGHLSGDEVVDVLVDRDGVHELRGPRIDTPNTHGTGCCLSAAIAACLAKGMDLRSAAERGKTVVTDALRAALDLGSGPGPVDPGGITSSRT